MSDRVHLFGVRHHGPGSSRCLVEALEALEALAPDILLVEGPPDAQEIVGLAATAGMEPPVAIFVYVPDDPRQAAFYPFAEFSPEWRAIRHGVGAGIPVRFIDLPQRHVMAMAMAPGGEDDEPIGDGQDPLAQLAEIAGYPDGESWWDRMVEGAGATGGAVFQAVAEAIAAQREARPGAGRLELRREAHMRQGIRAALKEGFQRIAVVCGAWHVPALRALPPAAEDLALLKGLPKVGTRAAWVPWSCEQLSCRSGYGAGVASPEWYHLLWEQPRQPVLHWMTRMARLLRDAGLDASSAQLIEAVRLAEALAAMRGRRLPGLGELLEGALAAVCGGSEAPLGLIERKLVLGERIGRVPEGLPLAPLQEDLAREKRRLRLGTSDEARELELDLRTPTDLDRSRLFHRLALLEVPWAAPSSSLVRAAGTFRECWRLSWRPQSAVALVEAARWGCTVAGAAEERAADRAERAADLRALGALLEAALLADLPAAVARILAVTQARAALSRDVFQMMDTLVPLARSRRYGSVRRTDAAALDAILDDCVERICIGLPAACSSLDDDAAAAASERIAAAEDAIRLLDRPELLDAWRAALTALADRAGLHALVAGRVARLLHDAGTAPPELTARRMHLALSTASGPVDAAHWIEGFLAGSAMLLVHDPALLGLLDPWLSGLETGAFIQALPLLRRTFATFTPSERHAIGGRLRSGPGRAMLENPATLVAERASRALPALMAIYGREVAA